MPISLPLSGSCRCGRVTMQVSAPPFMTAACHCRGCQKMASSAFSLTAMVPAEGFAVTEGETVVGGMHGDFLEHNFCAWCMSWMFTRLAGRDFVNVRPSFFDDVGWFRPYIETCTATKLPFAETGAVERFVEFPAPEEFGPLMERYRAWAG